jgi:signal transduction histidine kinase
VTSEPLDAAWPFSVIDNGPGIGQQYHSVIFELFKRLQGIDRPGSGIGLAFCRKFIEREGAGYGSTEGEGLRFDSRS